MHSKLLELLGFFFNLPISNMKLFYFGVVVIFFCISFLEVKMNPNAAAKVS